MCDLHPGGSGRMRLSWHCWHLPQARAAGSFPLDPSDFSWLLAGTSWIARLGAAGELGSARFRLVKFPGLVTQLR